MRRRKIKIALLLITVTIAGGLLVTLLNGSSSAEIRMGAMGGTFGAPGAANDPTIPLQNGLNSLGSSVGSLASAATSFGSSSSAVNPTPDQTIVVKANNDQGQAGADSNAPQRATTNVSRAVEFFSNVTLRVSSPSSSLDQASAAAYAVGGYVAYSTLSNSTAFVVLRVPAQDYLAVLRQVETMGTVVAAVSTSNDVTVQYTDLNATLASLTAEQTSLLRLLNQSTSINSTLQIQSILQEVNARINEVQSEILQTQRLITYGTISVSLERLTGAASARPLALKLAATPRSGIAPLSVTLNAIAEGGSPQYIVNYNFGDGTAAQGQALIHTFEQPGDYNITVTATDSEGGVTEAWTTVKVTNPPIASSFGNFPSFAGGLFIQVIEGIIEVAIVVLPLAGVIAMIVLPFRRRLNTRQKQQQDNAPPTVK